MGYSTDFTGHFSVTPTLTSTHAAYFRAFSETRHMIRDEKVCASLLDPVREAAILPIGREARFFTGEDVAGSVLAYNNEPEGVPGLWCQWVPTEDGTGIEWDQGEKFYEYEAWLTYLIKTFLDPWGYELNGTVQYRGEDPEDFGVLVVENNLLKVHEGVRTAPGFLETPLDLNERRRLQREIGELVLENSDLKAQLDKSIKQERGLTVTLARTRRKVEEAVSLTQELLEQLGHAHKFIVGTPEHDAIVCLLEPTITRIRAMLEPSQVDRIEAVAANVTKGLKS